jgi:prepilin peptidase CpaA
VLWWLLFACWILALIHADLRYRRVPNRLIVAGLAGQLLWLLAALLAPGWAYPPRWSGWLMALAGFLFDDDSSPVLRWTTPKLDTAGLSIT